MFKKIARLVFLLLLLGACALTVFLLFRQSPLLNNVGIFRPSTTILNEVMYYCADDKTISALFMERGSVPAVAPGEPPIPNGLATLSLSGSPTITLQQTISASGVRYATADEALVFWSKGSGAILLEGGEEVNYRNCISVKEDSANLPQVYLGETNRFTVRYPIGYEVNESYIYPGLSSSQRITGVKFTVAPSMVLGTNLSADTYISIEHRTGTTQCLASDFMSSMQADASIVQEGDITYSVANNIEAGAGNRYEEHVYAISGSNPCLAIRYFIHYTAIENYDAGTIVEFDRSSLLEEFDAIRESITVDGQFAPLSLLHSDVYPLYEELVWNTIEESEFLGQAGYIVTAVPLINIVDIASFTTPFEQYYAELLLGKGWSEDISLAAGGPGSANIVYRKDQEYITLQYRSEFGLQNENEPAQCPCTVEFSIFTST